MKCPVCGHKVPEMLAICSECMEKGGAGTAGVKQAQRLRSIARILSIEAGADANIEEAMRGILEIAAEVEKEG